MVRQSSLGLNSKKVNGYEFGFGLEPILKPNKITWVKRARIVIKLGTDCKIK